MGMPGQRKRGPGSRNRLPSVQSHLGGLNLLTSLYRGTAVVRIRDEMRTDHTGVDFCPGVDLSRECLALSEPLFHTLWWLLGIISP